MPSGRSCEDRRSRIAKNKKCRSSCFWNGISLNLLTHIPEQQLHAAVGNEPELVGGETPPSCWRKTALPLKSPTGAFIAPLRCANAVQPQNLLRTDEEELCQFDIIPPTTERNRAFPTGNALLYILLSYVDFSGCVRRGAPYFCFIMVGYPSKRIYQFFFSLAATWLVLRCSTIWANHSTIAGSS